MKIRTLLSHVIGLALLCGAAAQTFAQAPGGGRGGFLTQEQRTKMRDTMQGMQAQLSPLTNKLVAAQKEAIKAALAKDADPQVVRAKMEAVSKVQLEIAMLRLKAVKEIAPTLTDEQKTQLEERPGLVYNSHFGGFGMGFMMGGPGRRGGGAPGADANQ